MVRSLNQIKSEISRLQARKKEAEERQKLEAQLKELKKGRGRLSRLRLKPETQARFKKTLSKIGRNISRASRDFTQT